MAVRQASLPDPSILAPDSETGRLVASFNWTTTALGAIERWPQSLRTTLGLLLRSPLPIVLLWGEDGVMLYNDAYSAFAGNRHPTLLGSKVREGWPEVADFNDNVMRVGLAGGTLSYQDQELTLNRSGRPEQVFMNLDYSPVPDESSRPAGVLCILGETTERVLAERRREAAEARLRLLAAVAEQSGDFIGIAKPDGTGTYVNRAGRRMVGLPDDFDIAGVSMLDFFAPEDRSFVEGVILPAQVEHGSWSGEFRFRRFDTGETVPVLYHPFAIRDARGEITGFATVTRDITERIIGEEALRASEEFNRRVLQSSTDCIKVLDLDGRLDFMSEGGMCVMEVDDFGAVQGTPWPDFWQGDEHAKAVAAVEEARRGGNGRFQGFATTLKGTPRWWDVVVTPINGADGQPERLLAVSRDATAMKRVEEALRASEARFEAIADSIDQMIWATRPDGHHDYYNQRWYDYTGVPQGSTDGEAWSGMFHPDDQERAWTTWRHCLATGEPYRIEYRLRHRSGQYRWVLGRAQCVRDTQGQITRWFGTCTDIQDIVEARDVLARSREVLEEEVARRTAERDRIWQLSPDLMCVARTDGTLLGVNPAWERLLGWPADWLTGRNAVEIKHPDDAERTAAELARLAAGHPTLNFEDRYRHRDGNWRWISWVIEPEGDLIYCVGRDVTNEKERQAALEQAQEALRQAQKMETVGQLTGGVAHDFNNLLQIVTGNLEILQRNLPDDMPRLRRAAENAQTGAKRAAVLTQRLLAFSRRQPLAPKPIDVNKLVSGMSELLHRTLGETIELETVLASGLWRVEADPNQLENAILNLAVNARDAMQDGGKLTIESNNTHLDRGYTAQNAEVQVGQYVVICVSDTGTGMDAATAARVFEPFFTTKEVGKGTGLGLSMVYGFVKQSGGHVKIYSEPGQGTTVKLYLPRLLGTADEETEAAEIIVPEGTREETVLVCEDDDDVRAYSVESLRELGYRVLEAHDGASALRLLERQEGRVDLLFSDVVLPGGMTGADLAERACQLRPGLKVLFTTGYARDAIVHHGRLDAGVELITKPFAYADLAARVRDVLDANEERHRSSSTGPNRSWSGTTPT